MKVLRSKDCDLPANMQGAYVTTYAGATDFRSAVQKAVVAVTNMNYRFDDVQGKVREIPVSSWSDYVSKVWPDYSARLPNQEELPLLVERGMVFFGPFMGFEGPR